MFNLSATEGFSGTTGFSAEEAEGGRTEEVELFTAYREVYPVGELTPPADINANFLTFAVGDKPEPSGKEAKRWVEENCQVIIPLRK